MFKINIFFLCLALSLNATEFANYEKFNQKCSNINRTFKGNIEDFGKNEQEAIRNIINEAVIKITEQYYGALVNAESVHKIKENIINGQVNSKKIDNYSSTITTNGLTFYRLKKYPDEDGDMLDYKIKNNKIKINIEFDCMKSSYLQLKNFLLKKELNDVI